MKLNSVSICDYEDKNRDVGGKHYSDSNLKMYNNQY